ncbi:general secretion pathway protein GspN [Cupriavidus sp. USMAA2-4]|uniref:type II secretion system protein N n=1 Tax=unclassified Cupriavidus TaxID=2640874 RepID=UPI0008A6D17E|nr:MULTISPECIES: type II secretion system protein N [unclassified Cupriavidus]AOY92433.1 general secretion pathway protein GspN [Cupriavidus sp. USMAA2-4]AOY97984.1 general secretion pathway protein GspN [Cupriavidus sp. USMAHM13]
MARLEALRLRRPAAPAPRGWRRLGWLALGALVVGLTTLAALPAAWIADSVAAQSGQKLLLADAQGTLWQGSATLALSAGSGSETATVLPGRLQWTVAFWPLFTGRLRVTVRHTEAMDTPVALTVAPGGWQAQAGALRLPATLLEGLGAPFNSLRPDGRMQLDWTALNGSFSASGGQPAGHLTLRLDNLSSAVSRLRPLGSYRAEIDWSGGGGKLRLHTVNGPLHLEGDGTLGRQARFEGTAFADPDAAAQLVGLLSLLGRREDNVTTLRF